MNDDALAAVMAAARALLARGESVPARTAPPGWNSAARVGAADAAQARLIAASRSRWAMSGRLRD